MSASSRGFYSESENKDEVCVPCSGITRFAVDKNETGVLRSTKEFRKYFEAKKEELRDDYRYGGLRDGVIETVKAAYPTKHQRIEELLKEMSREDEEVVRDYQRKDDAHKPTRYRGP